MKCKDFNMEMINRYIDGELNPEEKIRLRNHLEKCKYCRNYIREIRDTISVVKERREVPDRIWERIKKRIHLFNRKRFVWRFIFVPAAAVAVFLFAFILSPEKGTDMLVDDYIQTQLSYLNGEPLIDSWYLELKSEEYVVDSLLNDEL